MMIVVSLILLALLCYSLLWGADWRTRAARAERECDRYRRRAREFFIA
jgi:hypothetical protein